MKALFLTALSLVIVISFTSVAVLAQDKVNEELCSGTGVNTEFCNEVSSSSADAGNNSLLGSDGVLTKLAQGLIMLTAAISVVMVIIAGLMFILGSGSPETVSKARRTVIYAIAGLSIAILGQVIVIFVLNRLYQL